MQYHVFRQDRRGKIQKIAETFWIEDALAMYRNWHAAKIVDSHTRVVLHIKNWTD